MLCLIASLVLTYILLNTTNFLTNFSFLLLLYISYHIYFIYIQNPSFILSVCVANDFKLWLAINICWIVKFQHLKAQNEYDYAETNIPVWNFDIYKNKIFYNQQKCILILLKAGLTFQLVNPKLKRYKWKTTTFL